MPDHERREHEAPISEFRPVVLVGLMGAGKTTVGRGLARCFNWTFVDCDHEIERRTGVRIPTIFEIEGEIGFRRRESATIRELVQRHNHVIASGGGVVIDPQNRALLRDAGLVVYLSAPTRLLYERTRHDRNRPLLQVEDPLSRLEQLQAERDPLYRETAHIIVDGGRHHANQIVHLLEQEVKQRCKL